MTETLEGAGRFLLPGAEPMAECEAGLVDRLIDLVLALEPLELKQQDADDAPGESMGDERAPPTPTLLAESTGRMLAQMRAVLDREAARLGADGTEGKAAVDQVSLIARTLEKIDQMERLIAGDQARTARQALSANEREQLRQTVRQLILAAAERLAAERRAEDLAAERRADGLAAEGGDGAAPDEPVADAGREDDWPDEPVADDASL